MVQTLVDPFRLISPIKTIQYVGGKTATTFGNTSSFSLDLTGLSGGLSGGAIQTDDMIIIGYCVGSDTDVNVNLSVTDYTEIADLYENPSSFDTNLGVFYRFASSAETSASIGGTGDIRFGGSLTVQVFRNVSKTTTFDVSTISGTATGGALVNIPAITPSTNGAFIVAIGGSGHGRGTAGTYSSSDLSGFISTAVNDSVDSGIGAGYKAWTTSIGTFDPAQWTFNDVNSINYSYAYSIMALRPFGA